MDNELTKVTWNCLSLYLKSMNTTEPVLHDQDYFLMFAPVWDKTKSALSIHFMRARLKQKGNCYDAMVAYIFCHIATYLKGLINQQPIFLIGLLL